MNRPLLTVMLILICAGLPSFAENPPEWTEPIEPFTIIGNIHYVGTADLTSYLITTPEGHILLDGPMDENVPLILASIRKLGFDPADVEIIIGSHAHFDHLGGVAAMKAATGARLLLSREDAALVARGGRDDFAFGDDGAFPTAETDRILEDGDVVELGGTALEMLLTPGHTKGGTSWLTTIEEQGRSYRVLFANSMSAPGYELVANPKYPGIMEDFNASFTRLEEIEADVFLSTHGSFFGLREKAAAMKRGGANPFIDAEALGKWIERWRGIVTEQYAKQTAR